jgi:hypothetical protein
MITVSIDTTKFAEQLRAYVDESRKDLAEIVNTKAFFISLKALRYTPAAKADMVRRELIAPRLAFRGGAEARRPKGRKGLKAVRVPLLYLILQARRARAGKKGFYGAEMREKSEAMLRARGQAVGFEKAGWVWNLRHLAPYVPSARDYAEAHNIRIGQTPTGRAEPAREGLDPTALILNRAWPKRQHAKVGALRLQTQMTNALQLAFDEETRSMRDYVNDKMTERIIKQHLAG